MDGFSLLNLAEMRYFLKCITKGQKSPLISEQLWDEAKKSTFSFYANSDALIYVKRCAEQFEQTYKAKYYSDLMKMFNAKKKSGANITGLTFWGLSDKVSWIKNGYPLLFSDINKPKKAYYSVIEASSNY